MALLTIPPAYIRPGPKSRLSLGLVKGVNMAADRPLSSVVGFQATVTLPGGGVFGGHPVIVRSWQYNVICNECNVYGSFSKYGSSILLYKNG